MPTHSRLTAATLAAGLMMAMTASLPVGASPPRPGQVEAAPAETVAAVTPIGPPKVTTRRDSAGDIPVNVKKAALLCAGYELYGVSAEVVDFPGPRFGQLRVYRDFDTGQLCFANLATKRVTGRLHASSITIFESDCATVLKEVTRRVRTRVVTTTFDPALGQDLCAEGNTLVVLDAKQPKVLTAAYGTHMVTFV